MILRERERDCVCVYVYMWRYEGVECWLLVDNRCDFVWLCLFDGNYWDEERESEERERRREGRKQGMEGRGGRVVEPERIKSDAL